MKELERKVCPKGKNKGCSLQIFGKYIRVSREKNLYYDSIAQKIYY